MDFKEALGGAFLCLGGEVVEVVGEAEKEGFFSSPKHAAFMASDVVGEGVAGAAEAVALFGESGGSCRVVQGGESEGFGKLLGTLRIANERERTGCTDLTIGDVKEGLGKLVEFRLV